MASWRMDNGSEDGADEPFSYAAYEALVADINAAIIMFEDILKSLKTSEEVRRHVLIHDLHTAAFPDMKQKLVLLINSYQEEDASLLGNMLSLFDKIDRVTGQYVKRLAGGTHFSEEKGVRVTTFTKTTTTTFTTTTMSTSSSTGLGGTNKMATTTEGSDLAHASIRVGDSQKEEEEESDEESPLQARGKAKERLNYIEILEDPARPVQRDLFTDITYAPDPLSDHQHSHDHEDAPKSEFKPQTDYRPAVEPGECPICCEDEVPPSDLCIFDQCSHQYCRECLRGYFDNLINDNKVLDISCPFPKCTTKVEYCQVQQVVLPAQFVRYEEFTFLASLNADPTVRWCPKVGCGNAIIGDPANSKCECTNPECKYEFCFQCSEPWHQDFSCEQYQEWKAENGLVDKKFSKWAKENTKKCPSCKALIEKMSGCNHMTCYKCKYEFCWLCNGKYTSSHFDVFNVLGCPGMQSGSKQFGMVKRVGMRALIGSGLVLGGIIGTALAIPVAVVAGPIYGGIKIHNYRMRRRHRPSYLL